MPLARAARAAAHAREPASARRRRRRRPCGGYIASLVVSCRAPQARAVAGPPPPHGHMDTWGGPAGSRVMPCHAMSYHVMPCHAMDPPQLPSSLTCVERERERGGEGAHGRVSMSWQGMSSHVVSCHAMSCHATMPCRIMSCQVVSCRVVSCRVMSCHVVSCRVMSCRVVSRTRKEHGRVSM